MLANIIFKKRTSNNQLTHFSSVLSAQFSQLSHHMQSVDVHYTVQLSVNRTERGVDIHTVASRVTTQCGLANTGPSETHILNRSWMLLHTPYLSPRCSTLPLPHNYERVRKLGGIDNKSNSLGVQHSKQAHTHHFKSHFLRHSAGTELTTETYDRIISGDYTHTHTSIAMSIRSLQTDKPTTVEVISCNNEKLIGFVVEQLHLEIVR